MFYFNTPLVFFFHRYAVAEQDCTKAILLGTKDPKAWFRRGSAREALKRYEEALADFEEVLRIDPRNKVAQGRIDAVRNVRPCFLTLIFMFHDSIWLHLSWIYLSKACKEHCFIVDCS